MTTGASSAESALFIDLDGVIYNDDSRIEGAAEAIAWVQEQGVPHLFLTNTTSRARSALVDKLRRMGIRTSATRIVSPPWAANRWLRENVEGPVALFVAESAKVEFTDIEVASRTHSGPVGAVVLGDYGDSWSFAELNRAFRLLMGQPKPRLIALGMTRYWHSADGLRLDTAPFVVALQHASGAEPVVVGKPAKPFFDMASSELGTNPERTWMIGDDIRGDIEGAQRAGLRAALVRTGKFRPHDLDTGVQPDAVLESIAELPQWWARRSGID